MTTVFVKKGKLRKWLDREGASDVTSTDPQSGGDHVDDSADTARAVDSGRRRSVVAAQSELGLRSVKLRGGDSDRPRRVASDRPLVTDEIDQALGTPALPIVEIVQRPNAVCRDGGPQLLRGLMLPLCPSSNRYWTQMIMPKKGTVWPLYLRSMKELFTKLRSIQFPSTDAKAYVATIKELAIQRGFMFNTDKPLRMDVVVCPRDRREIDAHNYTKVLLDALQEAQVYTNDSQVIDLRTRVGPIIKGGRLVVSMWETQSDPDVVLKEAWQ